MKEYKDFNDYELMYMVSDNNELATDIIYEKYTPIIKKISMRYLDEAKSIGFDYDDLMQEGYIALSKAIEFYDANNASLFYTYAIHSIVGAIINLLRKGSTLKNIALNSSLLLSSSNTDDVCLYDVVADPNAILPELTILEIDFFDQIKFFMHSLKFEYALIFELVFNGFSNKDISCLLDISINSVFNSIYRVRKKLKKYLASVEN